MKKEEPVEKTLKRFKKAMRPSLFLPVFYTVVFGLVIVSLFVLNDRPPFVQALLTVALVGVDLVFWLIFMKGRKNAKSVALAMDEAIERAEQGLEAQDRLSDEDWQTLSEALKRLIGLFGWFIALTSLCLLFFQVRQIVSIPDLVFYLVTGLMGAGIAFVIVFGIWKVVKFRQLSKELWKDTESKS